jgi:hypothetical protein
MMLYDDKLEPIMRLLFLSHIWFRWVRFCFEMINPVLTTTGFFTAKEIIPILHDIDLYNGVSKIFMRGRHSFSLSWCDPSDSGPKLVASARFQQKNVGTTSIVRIFFSHFPSSAKLSPTPHINFMMPKNRNQ